MSLRCKLQQVTELYRKDPPEGIAFLFLEQDACSRLLSSNHSMSLSQDSLQQQEKDHKPITLSAVQVL